MVTFDVVEAILSRSLVPDLLRCKSVCKSWYSLISTSPSFVKLHSKHMCNKEDYRSRIAMITSYQNHSDFSFMISPEWVSYDKWEIVGSFNGLVCMYSKCENRILLTNPSTREFVKVEYGKLPRTPIRVRYQRCFGFGYDSSTDDYKVVTAVSEASDRALVYILSLKSNNLKCFGQVDYRFDDVGLALPGILFNGALHWFWFDANSTSNKVSIVLFDLAKEEFREIPQPDDTRYAWNYGSTLGIIEGHLCIFTRKIYTYECNA